MLTVRIIIYLFIRNVNQCVDQVFIFMILWIVYDLYGKNMLVCVKIPYVYFYKEMFWKITKV